MNWKAFRHEEQVYDLGHLNEFAYDLVVPAKDDKPAQTYRLNVMFSIHCFTRGPKKDESVPVALAYSDSRETRIFDFERYEQSKALRGIIETLNERKCFHDRHGSFYVFEMQDAEGRKTYYSVFFSVSKSGQKAGLNLYVTSAHTRPESPYATNLKPIRFSVIVHNVWTGKGVKPAP